MTEDEQDWCIGLQTQAANWWAKAQHHLKMSETAKNWDSYEYARIHARIDQQYAALAYAKAHEILCAKDAGPKPNHRADAIRAREILMGIGGQPSQEEKARLALKIARQRGAP